MWRKGRRSGLKNHFLNGVWVRIPSSVPNEILRWCNGSTRAFGALGWGSNPCRSTKKKEKMEE